MNEKHLFSLFDQLWNDLSHPESYWSASMLAGALCFAWWLASRLTKRENGSSSGIALFHMDAEDLRRMAFPMLASFTVFFLHIILSVAEWEHLSLLELAMPLIFSWTLVRIAVYVLRRVFSRNVFLENFERWISLLIWGGVVLQVTGFADPMIGFLERISLPVGGAQQLNLWQLIRGFVTICLTLLISLWLASLLEERVSRIERLDRNARELFIRLSKSLFLALALLFSLSLVGIDVTMLSVFGGAFAVGLGFGLQKIASSYVSGFIILLDRSIRIGNMVSIDAGTTGIVTRITMRYTVLRVASGAEILIPNENLVGNIVRNLTFSDTKMRLSVAIQVAYDADVKKAMRLMIEAARRRSRVLSDPSPGVLLTEFADSGINLELGFWINDPEAGTGSLRSEIALDILETFGENGIEIPYPHYEVRLLNPAFQNRASK